MGSFSNKFSASVVRGGHRDLDIIVDEEEEIEQENDHGDSNCNLKKVIT